MLALRELAIGRKPQAITLLIQVDQASLSQAIGQDGEDPHLPLSFCISSLISSISGMTSKSCPPAEILYLPSLLRLHESNSYVSIRKFESHAQPVQSCSFFHCRSCMGAALVAAAYSFNCEMLAATTFHCSLAASLSSLRYISERMRGAPCLHGLQ